MFQPFPVSDDVGISLCVVEEENRRFMKGTDFFLLL